MGNEYFATRPHTAQNKDRIAAGSPLAIVGIFLETLRERFAPGNGLNINWCHDIQTTDIVIESGYNTETESRDAGRALYVNRINTSPTNVVVGNRVGVHLPDHKEGFMCMMGVQITVDCVSNDLGDSAILADIVQGFFMSCRNIFAAQYGIHDFGLAEMGQTQPFSHAQEKWSTTVSVPIMFQARWTTVKIRPLLQSISTRIQARGGGGFEEVAVESMQRNASAPAANGPSPVIRGYNHTELEPKTKWIVLHNLRMFPSISVVGTDGEVLTSVRIHHVTSNETHLHFPTATAGTARAV